MIRRLQCLLFGHKRGKCVHTQASMHPGYVVKDFRCGRCGGEWARHVKAKPKKEAT